MKSPKSDMSRWAEQIEMLWAMANDALVRIPEERRPAADWEMVAIDLDVLSSPIATVIQYLRVGGAIAVDDAASYAAAIRDLTLDAGLLVEALPDDVMQEFRFPARLERFRDGAFDAQGALLRYAEERDPTAVTRWQGSYIDGATGRPAAIVSPAVRLAIARELRAKVWDKSGGRCWYCGKPTNPFRDFHVDHLVPVRSGGSNDLPNLVPSCQPCNGSKGALSLDEFRSARGDTLFWFEIVRSGTEP